MAVIKYHDILSTRIASSGVEKTKSMGAIRRGNCNHGMRRRWRVNKKQLVYRGIHIKSLDAPSGVSMTPRKNPIRVFVRLKLARGCAVAAENFYAWLRKA